jgi:hypothetical protein
MNASRHASCNGQPDPLSPAQMLNLLVSAQALDAAQELLRGLDQDEIQVCIEEMRVMMHDEGIELPDWENLSENELRQIARGAFYLEAGNVVLMNEA